MIYRPDATVHGLFREQAAAHPGRQALRWDGGTITYGELDSQSDALATGALQEQLTADALVALLDKIGPSIVIPHSQPGAPAWLVGSQLLVVGL